MDIVFAVLPFADVERPAIGVSLLKAAVDRLGLSSRVLYCNIELAEMIGADLCTEISESLPSESLAGEWFFADLLFGDEIPHEHDYISRILSRYAAPSLLERILDARRRRDEFIERSVEQVRALKPRLVGFTTTFHQTCACLVLARRLKELPDAPVVVFGGANCEGEMGLQLLRSFNCIDYVCTGEGDVAFPAFAKRLLREGNHAPVPGILRRGESIEVTVVDLVRDMDSLPLPDYTDYFDRLSGSPIAPTIKSDLLIETSRGCWWGAKHHCTFCGLNGDTMTFRSKSPKRVFAEMKLLAETYGVKRIDSVDNILDVRFIPTLFPMLKESALKIDLFYEVKANLRYDQVVMIRAGGVCAIQPGIESFSNEVLRLMDKGCTGIQNIQLLRWCEEVGITPAWNLLAGFPGESRSEYQRMAELLPLLTHLQPPSACAPIRLDRFSPFFTRSSDFGMLRVRPTSAYYYVYPFGRRELMRLAYFFDFDYSDDRNPYDYLGSVKDEVHNWWRVRNGDIKKENYPRLDATHIDSGDILITDSRPCAPTSSRLVSGLDALVLAGCDSSRTVGGLTRRLDGTVAEADIRESLARLQADKLLVEMEGQYGSLPVFRNRPEEKFTGGLHALVQFPEAQAAQPLLHNI
jgi:ribosomal peptide maturation radical SAM protein 1